MQTQITTPPSKECVHCGSTFFRRATCRDGDWTRQRFCGNACGARGRRNHPRTTLAERFWKRVRKSEAQNGCWIWIGRLSDSGYGMIDRGPADANQTGAHRASWEIHRGQIPNGMWVLHNCPGGDNRACVRPDHLWLGTVADNNADAVRKGANRGAIGTANASAKLDEMKVREIRAAYAAGDVAQLTLGRRYGVSQEVISRIVRFQAWTHVP